jgi:hypothetical protein
MLGYQQDALEVEVNLLRSTTMLAAQASAMGMRPNPYAAIITLPAGTITGDLRAIGGWELGDQVFSGDERTPELPIPRVITEPKPPTWDIGKVEKTQPVPPSAAPTQPGDSSGQPGDPAQTTDSAQSTNPESETDTQER